MSNLDDLEERFRQMEREVNNKVETPMKSADPVKSNFQSEFNQATENTVETAKTSLSGLVGWINSLTGVTKIVAIAVVGILTFTIVKFLVNLVAAAISVAFMVAIAYLLYKLFFETKSAPKP
jgi:uncharacterized membrane protein